MVVRIGERARERERDWGTIREVKVSESFLFGVAYRKSSRYDWGSILKFLLKMGGPLRLEDYGAQLLALQGPSGASISGKAKVSGSWYDNVRTSPG